MVIKGLENKRLIVMVEEAIKKKKEQLNIREKGAKTNTGVIVTRVKPFNF